MQLHKPRSNGAKPIVKCKVDHNIVIEIALKLDCSYERKKREAAEAAEEARRAPWVYDSEWPEAFYDLNGDAFPVSDQQAVNLLLSGLDHYVLATHWYPAAPVAPEGQKIIADVVPLVLERALRSEGFTGPLDEFLAKIKVHPIPQSSWVIVDCLGEKAQQVLETQAAVYNRVLHTAVIFRKLEMTPSTTRIITALEVKRTTDFEDELKVILEQDTRMLGGSTLKKVEKIGRQLMHGTGRADTREFFFRVELEQEDAARVYDKWGSVMCRKRQIKIRASPCCHGCKSRNHGLTSCGWIQQPSKYILDNNLSRSLERRQAEVERLTQNILQEGEGSGPAPQPSS